MSEKSKFNQVDATLPAVCCGRCANGAEKIVAGNLGKAIECTALPPVPVLVPGPQGQPGVQSLWPLLDPRKACGCFTPRATLENKPKKPT